MHKNRIATITATIRLSGGGFIGFFEEAFAVAGQDGLVDLGWCKNEAILLGVVGFSFILEHFRDVEKMVQVTVFLGTAGFLEVAELGHGLFELAGEALAVHAEIGEGFRLVKEAVHEVPGGVRDAEEVAFEAGHAVEAPGDVGQGLDEIFFGGALGMVFVVEGF